MFYKKAQSEIITTILIILLVLAAIVILWQVVVKIVRTGSESIEKQSGCLDISMDVLPVKGNTTAVVVRRNAGGKVLTGTSAIYIENGNSKTYPGARIFGSPLESEQITIPANVEIEVALKLNDGTVCPNSGKGKAGTA